MSESRTGNLDQITPPTETQKQQVSQLLTSRIQEAVAVDAVLGRDLGQQWPFDLDKSTDLTDSGGFSPHGTLAIHTGMETGAGSRNFIITVPKAHAEDQARRVMDNYRVELAINTQELVGLSKATIDEDFLKNMGDKLGVRLEELLVNPREGIALFVESARPLLKDGPQMLRKELEQQFDIGACDYFETQHFIDLLQKAKPSLD